MRRRNQQCGYPYRIYNPHDGTCDPGFVAPQFDDQETDDAMTVRTPNRPPETELIVTRSNEAEYFHSSEFTSSGPTRSVAPL